MIRSAGFRAIAALTGLAAGFAVATSALAHGLAHAHVSDLHATQTVSALEAGAHHRHGVATRHGESHHAEPLHSVVAGSGEDHGHPRIEIAPTARLDVWSPEIVAHAAIAFDEIEDATSAVVVTDFRLPGPAPPGAPAPRLRAPPTR